MARSGEFTRFPESPVFIPEVIRTPGYPAFVAVIYRLFGEQHAAGRDRAGAGVRADLRDGVRAGPAYRRRADGHRRGTDDGVVPTAALLRRAGLDGSVDDVRDDAGDAGVPARRPAGTVARFHPRRRCCSAPRPSCGPHSCCCRSGWPSPCRCSCRPRRNLRRARPMGRAGGRGGASRWCRGSPITTSISDASRCRRPAASDAGCGKARGRAVGAGASTTI